jgi:hypothetical protein
MDATSPPAAKRRRCPERSPPVASGGLGASALQVLPQALSALAADFPPSEAADLPLGRLEELEDALRSLTEIARAGKDAKRAAAAAAHNASQSCVLLHGLLSQADIRDVLMAHVPFHTLSSRLGRTCKTLRGWAVGCAARRGVTAADVAATVHVRVLRHLCTLSGATIRLAPGRYQLGDARNADHLLAGTYAEFERSTQVSWDPSWRAGFGPLSITGDGVTLIGPRPASQPASQPADVDPGCAARFGWCCNRL